MPDFDDRIDVFCRGDDREIRRIVKDIPTGQTVTQAWLTIKEKQTQTDGEAIIQKAITTIDQVGVGKIEDAGAAGTAILRFDLRAADTLLLSPDAPYFHDVQIKTSGNKITTPFRGMTTARQQITIAS